MQLPKTVKIGGHIFKIIFPYVFKERFDQWAQIDHALKEVRIGLLDSGGTKRTIGAVIVSFIHEMLHGIDSITGHAVFVDDEKAIEGFSEGIYQILVDNGWLDMEKLIEVTERRNMEYLLKVTPAISPAIRHKIEDVLKKNGFEVHGGGTHTDKSSCDISFEEKESRMDRKERRS